MNNWSITISWNIDDVHNVVNNLSDEEAYEVLLAVKKHHNAEQGITWDTLRITALSMFSHATGS